MVDMNHLLYLDRVARSDSVQVKKRELKYKGSWKRRGGIGAFMMTARKWDRIENDMEKVFGYDVFKGVEDDPSGKDGSVLAEIRDLRQYLLLIEAEMVSRKLVAIQNDSVYQVDFNLPIKEFDTSVPRPETSTPGTPDDGGHHALFNDKQNDDMSPV